MKKTIFALLAFGLMTLGLNAQVDPATTNDSIIFDKVVHDYGTISKGSDGSSAFTFTNKGKSPLILSNVRSSCGCTIPQWPKEPIAPGKTGTIKVKYDTNRVGPINKSITVLSNAANASVVLRIKGTVTATTP